MIIVLKTTMMHLYDSFLHMHIKHRRIKSFVSWILKNQEEKWNDVIRCVLVFRPIESGLTFSRTPANVNNFWHLFIYRFTKNCQTDLERRKFLSIFVCLVQIWAQFTLDATQFSIELVIINDNNTAFLEAIGVPGLCYFTVSSKGNKPPCRFW